MQRKGGDFVSDDAAKPTKRSTRKLPGHETIPDASGTKPKKRGSKSNLNDSNRGGVTEAWLAAGTANLAKGRAKKKALHDAANAAGLEPVSVRWAKMLDGSMTVKDLSIEELNKMQLVNKDGSFGGPGRAIPSHIAQAMRNETIRRAQGALLATVNAAAEAMGRIINDPEASSADITRAANVVMDRVMGKPTETVVITNESEWDKGSREAVALDREMEMVNLLEGDADA